MRSMNKKTRQPSKKTNLPSISMLDGGWMNEKLRVVENGNKPNKMYATHTHTKT